MKHAVLALALIMSPGLAFAQSQTITNSATVVSACSISTTQNLNFGLFNPLDPQELRGTGSISVACTYGNYSVNLSNGNGGNSFLYNSVKLPSTGGGGWNVTYGCWRGMTNSAGQKLYYDLYADSNYQTSSINTGGTSYTQNTPSNSSVSTSPCQTTNTASFTTASFTNNAPQNITIYGKVSLSKGRPQSLQSGSYTDQVSVSITF